MKKIIISILTIILMSLAFVGSSYAAQLQATIQATPDKTEVKAGDKVVFTLKTINIANADDDSVSAIMGTLVWDKDFFEIPSDGTGSITLNGTTGDFNSMTSVKNGGVNGTIILKVKDDATGTGTVKFTNLEASDGRLDAEGTVSTSDLEIKIKIAEPTKPTEPTDPTEPTEPTDPSEPAEPTDPTEPKDPSKPADPDKKPGENNPAGGTTVVVGGDKDNTVADKNIPKAGANVIKISGIIVFLIVVAVIYKKNQSFRDIK